MEKEMNINEILIEICNPKSIYNEMINNVLKNKQHLKSELISEIAIWFIGNSKKVEDVYQKGYFKYYFLTTLTNQVNSSTSSFYKQTRLISQEVNESILREQDNVDEEIKKKLKKEQQFKQLEDALEHTQLTWIELECFTQYYGGNKTYRILEKEMKLDHCLIFNYTKKAKEKISNYIKQKQFPNNSI